MAIRDALISAKRLASTALAGFEDRVVMFPEYGFTDPWLEWRIRKSTAVLDEPSTVLLLQDWGSEEHFRSDCQHHALADLPGKYLNGVPTFDRTCDALQKKFGDKIRDGSLLVMNAVWALRKGDAETTGYLSDKIHAHAFPVWCSFLEALAARGHLRCIFFCGEWAKWSEWSDSVIPIVSVMRQWQSWSRKRVTDQTVQVAIDRLRLNRFARISGGIIPHPSTWLWSFDRWAQSALAPSNETNRTSPRKTGSRSMMLTVPAPAHVLFTSASERMRYEEAARKSKTDIRVLLGDKLKVITRGEGAKLNDQQLSLLLSVVLRGARAKKSAGEMKKEWQRLIDDLERGGNLAAVNRGDDDDDLFVKGRRLPGHFQANY